MSHLFLLRSLKGAGSITVSARFLRYKRRGLMKGTGEQLYILRDEVMHCAFGLRVVRQLISEENLVLDPKAIKRCGRKPKTLNRVMHTCVAGADSGPLRRGACGQFRFVANRRARQLRFPEPFPGALETLPWLDEQARLRKEKLLRNPGDGISDGAALAWVTISPAFLRGCRSSILCCD